MSASIVARGPSTVRMRFKPGLVGKTGDNTVETSEPDAIAGTGVDGRMSARRTAAAVAAQVPGLVFDAGAPTVFRDRVRQRRSITDGYRTVDNGDIAPAVARLLAENGGGTREIWWPDDSYQAKQPIVINRSHISMRMSGRKSCELRLMGLNDYLFDVGNSTSQVFNIEFENFLITKELVSTQGAVWRMRNASYWGVDKTRIFADNKFHNGFELASGGSAYVRDILAENLRGRFMTGGGGTTSGGTVGGILIDIQVIDPYILHCNQTSADPANDGVFYFEDNFQAIWIINAKVGVSPGYAVYFKGTLANRGNNSLNLVFNPNIEASAPMSGIVRFGAVAASHVAGPSSWSTGSGRVLSSGVMPAIQFDPDSQSNFARQLQVGLARAGSYGVLDGGLLNTVEDMDFVGYDGLAEYAIVLDPTSSKGRYRRNKVGQMLGAVYNNAPASARHIIKDLDYTTLSGPALTGLSGSSSYVIEGITDLDATGDPVTIGGGNTLTLPHKGDVYEVLGTTLDKITPTYSGQKVHLLFTNGSGGQRINDLQSGPGTGALYLKNGSGYTTTDGRTRLELQWRGNYWWEL